MNGAPHESLLDDGPAVTPLATPPLDAKPRDMLDEYYALETTLSDGAQRLLAQAVMRDSAVEHRRLVKNPEELRSRAEALDATIETQLDLMCQRHTEPHNAKLREEIDRGQDSLPPGNKAWTHDIMLAMLRGEQTKVWLDLRPPEVRRWRTYDASCTTTHSTGLFVHQAPPAKASYVERADARWPDYESGIRLELAAMLYAIRPPGTAMRLMLNLKEPVLRHEKPELSTLLAAQELKRYGLPDVDELGNEVVVTAAYARQNRIPEAINRLIASGNGYVDMKFGQIKFAPAAWLQWWYDLQQGNQRPTHEPMGIHLANRTLPTQLAAKLTAFLDPNEADYNHVLISGGNSFGSDTSLRVLLRALDVVHTDTCQIMRSDSHMGNYKVLKTLQNEVRKYLQSLGTYASFDDLDVEAYVKKNYPPKIMLQDREIMEESVEHTPVVESVLGIDPGRPETLLGDGEAMHVCAGGNPYPIMLRSWMTRPGSSIAAWDIAPEAKAYMDRVKYEGHDAERWIPFQDFMAAAGKRNPGLYVNCFADTRDKLDFVLQDIDNLPEGQARYIGMHFGREANVLSQGPFYKTARIIRRAFKDPDSIFEGVFTVESDPEWPDGTGKKFRAVSMLGNEIELALVDADMEVLVRKVIGKDVPPEERVRPNELFLYVLARPRRK